MGQGTTTTTTPNGKPKRERKAPGPMTPTKALDAIAKLRDKAKSDEGKILAQLSDADRARVQAFLEAA
jgi:hypothetical protein